MNTDQDCFIRALKHLRGAIKCPGGALMCRRGTLKCLGVTKVKMRNEADNYIYINYLFFL